MFNVCPVQESKVDSCNLIAADSGDELMSIPVDRGWYKVVLSGTVVLDAAVIASGTGFGLYVDRKLFTNLPSGTFNAEYVLQASDSITVKATRTVGDLVQVTYNLTVTKIKPLCCE